MKQFILLLLSLSLSTLAVGQLQFSPEPVVTLNIAASDFEGVGHATITNTSNEERNLNWMRNIVDMTEGWTSAVCDKNQCWLSSVETKNFTLAPDEVGTMDVHVYPDNNEGSAIIEILVSDLDDSEVTASNIYYFNQDPSSTFEVDRITVKVYPNPSDGLFTVQGGKEIARVEVFNLTGRLVRTFTFQDGKWYNITDLPRGTYLVRMLNRSAQTLTTKLFNKM